MNLLEGDKNQCAPFYAAVPVKHWQNNWWQNNFIKVSKKVRKELACRCYDTDLESVPTEVPIQVPYKNFWKTDFLIILPSIILPFISFSEMWVSTLQWISTFQLMHLGPIEHSDPLPQKDPIHQKSLSTFYQLSLGTNMSASNGIKYFSIDNFWKTMTLYGPRLIT